MADYACREPGCGSTYNTGDTATDRRNRARHEQHEHLNSLNRAWPCPQDCGPLGCHYDDEALRAHIRRAHGITGPELDAVWPAVLAARAVRVDAIRKQAETGGELPQQEATAEPQAVTEPAEATVTPVSEAAAVRRRNVYQELSDLLDDWQTLQADLERAEAENGAKDARIAELAMENAALKGENKTLRDVLSVVSDAVESVRASVGGDGAMEGEPA